MSKDSGTRSGLLWEVERILDECKELNQLPEVLLMENVPQVHGEGNVDDFIKWQSKLEKLGYKNYWKDLIATDYGIPQTRNRCFMISILGDYSYTFPQPIPLKLKLKDMLEDEVDEKYYLNDEMKKYIFSENTKYKVNKNNMQIDRDIACTKTTHEGRTRADTSDYVTEIKNKSLKETLKQNKIDDTCYIDAYNKRIDKEKSGTITVGVNFRNTTFLAVKNATEKGYLEATDGDGIDLSQPSSETKRGRVQKEKTQTLTTMGGNNNGVIVNNLRIRKLIPKECFRLMGVKDEDYERIAANQSNASLYHLAGDSIVVDVLMAIFKELL